MNSSSILFLFALFLSPFYFFRSGLPQIADFVYVISVLPFFYNFKKFNFLLNTWPKTLVLFIIWVSIVSTFWFLNLGDPKFLMPLFYYLFNFIITATLLIF